MLHSLLAEIGDQAKLKEKAANDGKGITFVKTKDIKRDDVSILGKADCRHQALIDLEIIPIPTFDPKDECLDEVSSEKPTPSPPSSNS